MPRKKKTKSREQVTAENYFPVNQTDLAHAVEKEYKVALPLPTIELKFKKRTKKKQIKTAKKIQTSVQYESQKVNLKKEGYELIITEKPQAAVKIASSLGKATTKNIGGVNYYEVDRKGKKIIVTCAVGHLFTLTQRERNAGTPVFDIYWVPNYLAKKNDFTKRYYDSILRLVKGAGSVTIATDYDVEGEVIGLNIVRYLCGQEDANRMKFSTLTSAELNNSYENKLSHLDWGQAIAGETRHYLDWLYGINLSRALMDAIKSTGRFKIMSIGKSSRTDT